MEEKKLRKLIYAALMAALITVGTMIIQIPTPATKGYINVGDSFIFLTAALFGPSVGFAAGGIGSGLADFLSGYAYWSPWTFFIKGIEGFIVGIIYKKFTNIYFRIFALILGAIWMVFGYYAAGGILYGFKAALADVPSNIIQGAASIILGYILINLLLKIKVFSDI